MSTTEFEAVPAVGTDTDRAPGSDPADIPSNVVVMKFGGTSVAAPERILAVARRLAAVRDEGHRVVGVLSAMGDSTDELLALAREISPDPQERELDMLVSVGERISCALAAMALIDLGYDADLLDRFPGGDRHGHTTREGKDRRGARAAYPRGP